ncbi:conserved hypothetical protein [Treponema primitia ZAS-2]|uniref:6-hydroxymethylpterin diphosphokinase MptE-like domain-containing protein n=1 Tax=Treponema primitia (strain ATCC BAA-887 / DSM 12427 / ZAS-2) TaxID=545694 RepID=F5YH09_TREPZ|nr:6-hydroxymethylpterin diphosphokinase MptE-like protein [Treponema primitia]AEF85977.1 conserved hypothetical protein [Treponema primitia ZAS-2]
MNKGFYFERNLLALSRFDPALCSRLSGAETTRGRYRFIESRSGESIPALVDNSGAAHPLHSLVDPRREGKRLISTLGNEGFLIIFGLGGGFHIEAALEKTTIEGITVIDFDIHGVAELLSSREYIGIFNDPRFRLLVDPSAEALEQYILDRYKPVICGGISLLPLRTRADFSQGLFNQAGEAIKSAIDMVSADYSVQAYFGKRWFSNIIRNIAQAEQNTVPLAPVHSVAICAAGPSLDAQIPLLAERKNRPFIIAADTALPALISAGLTPDAVVSIDCQHISYYHFMAGLPEQTLLFLDLASPPLVASRSPRPYFFSGGHPLTRYISRYWRPIPEVDTSGANVTYAALSLAEYLCARNIELYGADFSYPRGTSYARGTYIRSLFENKQNRCIPLEALHSAFLYRTPLFKQGDENNSWYYETKPMAMYRLRLEEKVRSMKARIVVVPGMGAPIRLETNTGDNRTADTLRLFSSGKAAMGALEFLAQYRAGINALPLLQGPVYSFLTGLSKEETIIFTTLLPAAAALKRSAPELDTPELFDAVKKYCVGELEKLLGIWGMR